MKKVFVLSENFVNDCSGDVVIIVGVYGSEKDAQNELHKMAEEYKKVPLSLWDPKCDQFEDFIDTPNEFSCWRSGEYNNEHYTLTVHKADFIEQCSGFNVGDYVTATPYSYKHVFDDRNVWRIVSIGEVDSKPFGAVNIYDSSKEPVLFNFSASELMKVNVCYRVDFSVEDDPDFIPDSEYIYAGSDDEALEVAKKMAADGVDYADAGHINTEVREVVLVDETQECYPDLKTIYY